MGQIVKDVLAFISALIVVFVSAMVIVFGFTLSAQAEQQMIPCAPHDARVAELKARFGETVQTRAMNFDGKMLEIFAAPGGSWTAVLTGADGLSCLVAGGHSYRPVAPGDPA